MPAHTALSPTAQTAYAQLFDAAQAREIRRSVAQLRGSFASKQVKGKTYWYFQFTEVSGKLRQVYVGPDSERVRALIASQGEPEAAQALKPLARAAEALGCEPVLVPHYRVVQRIADYGFFNAGGVMIGTHAFLCFGNMLGVRWVDGRRTQDVDFAQAGKQIEIALPANLEINTHAAIESLQMGFLPLGSSDGKTGATYLSPRDPDFRIDFVTPLQRGGPEPFRHPQLGVVLQPLRFMEYLLQDVQQAAVFCSLGATVINVPNPARYALHKLIVFGERPLTRAVKANKDLLQAGALLELLKERADWEVKAAWEDLVRRGPGWVSRVARGHAGLSRHAPALGLSDWLPLPASRS